MHYIVMLKNYFYYMSIIYNSMTLSLTQSDVEKKYNIPMEFPIRITLFGQSDTNGMSLPLGDYDYDFLTLSRSTPIIPSGATIRENTKLTIYSEPNGMGFSKVYINHSDKMMSINFPKNFCVKSFSVNSLTKSDVFVGKTFFNYTTRPTHHNLNMSYVLLIIFIIIILYAIHNLINQNLKI